MAGWSADRASGNYCLYRARNCEFRRRNFLNLILSPPQGLPRSGGEKNYLEYIYRRPRFLTTCTFAVYAVMTVSRLIAIEF